MEELEVKFLKNELEWVEWNNFVENNPLGSIHQISLWGQFQSNSIYRDKFWIIAVFENGKIIGGSLVIRQKLPFGKCWFYLPRGPLVDLKTEKSQSILNKLFIKLKLLAKQEKTVWIRIDPEISMKKKFPGIIAKEEIKINWKKLGFKNAHAHYQPENTVMLDLTMNEQEILAQMKPKGRYNIKVAERNNVIIHNMNNLKQDSENFYKILKETTVRDKFNGHELKYYQDMLKILGPEHIQLYLAEYVKMGEQPQIIAGIIVTFFKDLAIYYFGASSNQYRNVMAPYLLQWTAIKEARERGLKRYDFLGVAPENSDANHPWAGVTGFKLKFGGKRVDFYPAQEMVVAPIWMWLIGMVKMLFRMRI